MRYCTPDYLLDCRLRLTFSSNQRLWKVAEWVECGTWVDTLHFLVSNHTGLVLSVWCLCEILLNLSLANQTSRWVIDGSHCLVYVLVHHWLLHVEVILEMVSVVVVKLSDFLDFSRIVFMALPHFLIDLALLVLVVDFHLVVEHWLVFAMLNAHFLGMGWCVTYLDWWLSNVNLGRHWLVVFHHHCFFLANVGALRLAWLECIWVNCLFHWKCDLGCETIVWLISVVKCGLRVVQLLSQSLTSLIKLHPKCLIPCCLQICQSSHYVWLRTICLVISVCIGLIVLWWVVVCVDRMVEVWIVVRRHILSILVNWRDVHHLFLAFETCAISLDLLFVLLIQHHLDLLVRWHALVVCLVVDIVGETFNNELFTVSVSTDLVLVRSFVLADYLVYLWNYFPAVVAHLVNSILVVGLLVHAFAALSSHDVVYSLVLIYLHDLCLLLQSCVRSGVETSVDVCTHRLRVMQGLHALMRLI